LKYAHLLHPFLITLVVLIPGWSWAADIHVTRIDVEKHRFATITITGRIDRGDVARFKEIVDSLRSASYNDVIEVEVNSQGGQVIPAMEIGTIIRDNWLWTSVLNDTGAVCYSSCVFIFAAGAVRIQADLAPIGIHSPFFEAELFAGLDKAEAKKKYDTLLRDIRVYLDKMGMAPEVYQAMTRVPSNELRILSAAEIENWNISGKDPAYVEYNRAKNVAKYGEAKMREFDEWMKITKAYIVDCESKGKSPEVCAHESYGEISESGIGFG
jgi:hypothetical protein